MGEKKIEVNGIDEKILSVVRSHIRSLSKEENAALERWAIQAISIRNDTKLSTKDKLAKLSKLESFVIVRTLVIQIFKSLKSNFWDERSFPTRFAIGGLAVGLASAGSQAAGVAAFGTAVGVPIFILTSAGGALIGAILHEIKK